MKAISISGKNKLSLVDVTAPAKALPGHVIIKMQECGVNSGDKLFIAGAFPRGIPSSKYDIAGVSGVGTIIETGKDVPAAYQGKNVTVYRSLKSSEHSIGTWSEYAHLPYLNCVILPSSVSMSDYSGSLVNIITPYAFLKQAIADGHKGIICTAGNSATGRSMCGLCLVNDFPVILIVRSEKSRNELKALGATNVLNSNDTDFKEQLKETAQQLNCTAIFDGVGGELLTSIMDVIPFNSTIYSYGFLDSETMFRFPTKALMRGIIIKGFSNFRTKTVTDETALEKALQEISKIIHMPHFKTKTAKIFSFEEASEALTFSSITGKAALSPASF